MTRIRRTAAFLSACFCFWTILNAQNNRGGSPGGPSDPGPRGGGPSAGAPLSGLTNRERAAFLAGQDVFTEENDVKGTLTGDPGLGPTFNLDSCGGCHAQPAVGGTSPATNPQIAVATRAGAGNRIPPFITLRGPVREARFVRNADGTPDGGVHGLFTITGRSDADGCNIPQPDFAAQLARNNVVFRIPTPVFGAGLIEAIDDTEIIANKNAGAAAKNALGISGRENRSGNDGSIMRFGWKAQNKSLFIFAAEAYNVEQGVSSDLFGHERGMANGCSFGPLPEDHVDVNENLFEDATGDVLQFTLFMKFLAPPARGAINESVTRGETLFSITGCAFCHTPSMRTGPNHTAALSYQTVNLYSDLLLHDMGTRLADGITQGNAGGREWRTAPLWGLGQRLFFLHDGRADNLLEAIAEHSSQGSEANAVISRYNALSTQEKQDVLNFLRSL